MKALFALVMALLLFTGMAQAADSLSVTLNKLNFSSTDTLVWHCDLKSNNDSLKLATIHLWIEDVKTGKTWQYRFPMINKASEGVIYWNQNIPDGKYALNFLVQRDFFSIKGKARDYSYKDTSVNYLMRAADGQPVIASAPMERGGFFEVKKLLFQDTAQFIFTSQKGSGDYQVSIKTPLDSTFTPVASATQIIRISQFAVSADVELPPPTAPDYKFDVAGKWNEMILPEVVVKAKSKTLGETFAESYVTSRFKTMDEISFSGLDNDDIANSTNIFMFLQGRVGGLTFTTSPNGSMTPTWRGGTTTLYMDEFQVDADQISSIAPADVALIKVYRPNSTPLTSASNGSGGAIGIYTKRGGYSNEPSKVKSMFRIKGYDALELYWK